MVNETTTPTNTTSNSSHLLDSSNEGFSGMSKDMAEPLKANILLPQKPLPPPSRHHGRDIQHRPSVELDEIQEIHESSNNNKIYTHSFSQSEAPRNMKPLPQITLPQELNHPMESEVPNGSATQLGRISEQEFSQDFENDQSQSATTPYRVEIMKDSIPEEGDSEAAFNKVFSTLRAEPTISKRGRGRRDMARRSMIEPHQQPWHYAGDNTSNRDIGSVPSLPPQRSLNNEDGVIINHRHSYMAPGTASPAMDADTASVMSGRSGRSTLTMPIRRHPEIEGNGLAITMLEVVNALFINNVPSQVNLNGEIAFAYHPDDISNSPSETVLQIKSDLAIQQLVSNQSFITPKKDADDRTFVLKLQSIPRPSVGIKYLSSSTSDAFKSQLPILLNSVGRFTENQADIIVFYNINSEFRGSNNSSSSSIVFKHLSITLVLDQANSHSCQAKPAGSYNQEKNSITWKFPDSTQVLAGEENKLLARFGTSGTAKISQVFVKFVVEDFNEENVCHPVQVVVDAQQNATGSNTMHVLPVYRSLVSGQYLFK